MILGMLNIGALVRMAQSLGRSYTIRVTIFGRLLIVAHTAIITGMDGSQNRPQWSASIVSTILLEASHEHPDQQADAAGAGRGWYDRTITVDAIERELQAVRDEALEEAAAICTTRGHLLEGDALAAAIRRLKTDGGENAS
jgi:hypothetical protein